MSIAASNFSLYNTIIKPLRDADSTQLLLRYLKGPQTIRQDIESEVLSLFDQVKPDKVRADLLQYLLPIVGFTSELRSITDRLTDDQLRRLALVAVPLWNQRHTRSGLVNAIRLLTGRAAHVTDWFAYRAILDEVALTGDDPDALYIPPFTYVGAGGNGVTSLASTITVSVPSFTQPGDTLFVFTWSGETNDSKLNTAAIPLGWELCSETNTATRQQVCCLRKKVISHEVSSYVFPEISRGAGFPLAAIMVAYRGLDTSVAMVSAGVTDVPALTTVFTTPALAVNGNTDLYIGFTADHNSASSSVTLGTDLVERVDTNASSKHLVVFDNQAWNPTTSGPYNTITNVTSTGIAAGFVFRIMPRPENDLWIIGGQFSTYDEFTTNIRLMDDGNLDEQLLIDVCRLMRPLDERFEIFLDDFLDTFDGELDKWSQIGGVSQIIDGKLHIQISGVMVPSIPIVPIAQLHDYNVAMKFMLSDNASWFKFRFYLDLNNGANGYYEVSIQAFSPGSQISMNRTGVTIQAASQFDVAPGVWYGLRVAVTNVNSTTRAIRILIDNNQVVPLPSTGLTELIDINAAGPSYGNLMLANNIGFSGHDILIDNLEIWRNPGRSAIIDISTPTERGGAVTMTPNFIQ